MAEYTEAEVVRDLAFDAVRPSILEVGKRYAWFDGTTNTLTEVDLTADMPARRAGTVVVRDVASFAAYYAKHADDASEVFADIDKATVTAVLDAHHGAEDDCPARWQGHRLVLALQTTLPWRTWLEFDRKMLPQVAFAEFLEDNYRDLHSGGTVKAAELLEIAQSFQVSTKSVFVSAQRLSSGEFEVVMSEAGQASAGRNQKISIPTEFDLAIAPYEDCSHAVIAARFRYRASSDGLRLGYFLNQPHRHAEAAVKEIVEKVAAAIGDKPVMLGVPS
jgi:uncharacterized protein YfdQ (DUF2303 family)